VAFADMDFDNLRPLAQHILQALASARPGLELDDPEDPLDTLRNIQRLKEMGGWTEWQPRSDGNHPGSSLTSGTS
jgi:hypothetical protein